MASGESMETAPVMEGVREYGERSAVHFCERINGRPTIRAYNEGGYNCTDVDLIDVILWVRENRPDLLDP